MAANSKAQAEPQAQPKVRAVECTDDSAHVMGGRDLKATPFAINPDAGAVELAIGVQTRVKRLLALIVSLPGDDDIGDALEALAGYTEEIAALADATADALQYAVRSTKAATAPKSEAANG